MINAALTGSKGALGRPGLSLLLRRQVPSALKGQALFSSYGRYDGWPISKTNTILNIVPQGHSVVVERFGKMNAVQPPGLFLAIPLVDRLAYLVDMRERAMEIHPQRCITKDNVSVDVSGNVYIQFVDAERAAYGSRDPLYAVLQHAQSAMRAAVGEMELDDILHSRARLNANVRTAVQEASAPWGLEVKRYEITEILPDQRISEAMDKQAAAERNRREQVLNAEGEKRARTLESEGVKQQLINESEGRLQQVRNEAAAERERLALEAEGRAAAVRAEAEADAAALRAVAAALAEGGSSAGEAARLEVAKRYIEMYGRLAGKSNTMVFSERPGDVGALAAQAAAAFAQGAALVPFSSPSSPGAAGGGGGVGAEKAEEDKVP